MFCFSPNVIQFDGSVTARQPQSQSQSQSQSTLNFDASSALPLESIVAGLRAYLGECSSDEPLQNAIQAVIAELQGKSKQQITLIWSLLAIQPLKTFVLL